MTNAGFGSRPAGAPLPWAEPVSRPATRSEPPSRPQPMSRAAPSGRRTRGDRGDRGALPTVRTTPVGPTRNPPARASGAPAAPGIADAPTVVLPAVRAAGYDYYADRGSPGSEPPASEPPGGDVAPDGADGGPGRRGPGIIGVIGELVLTLGVVVLLFVIYEVYWTDLISAGKQQQATSALDQRWRQGEDPLTNARTNHLDLDGQGFAKLFVPSFGPDFAFTILQGTDDATLESGPGHYKDTAMPGEPGDFAVAGHRVGKGSPFNDLGLLNSCDGIVVETAAHWYVYRVLPMPGESAGWANGKGANDPHCAGVRPLTGPYARIVGREIVLPTDGDVILPVPDRPDLAGLPANPVSLITLTTCHPQFSDKQRMVLHGVLVKTYPNDPAHPVAPPELTEGR